MGTTGEALTGELMQDAPTVPALRVPDNWELALRVDPDRLLTRFRNIQRIVDEIMKEDIHYGIVPGTRERSLWQAGAETLCSAFLLGPEYEILSQILNDEEVTFTVRARIISIQTGAIIASGIGAASSKEEKYKWRRAVSEREFENTPQDRRRMKTWIDKSTGEIGESQQVRTNPFDQVNTIFKMAAKRALVSGTRTGLAISHLFHKEGEEPERKAKGGGKMTAKQEAAINKLRHAKKVDDGEYLDLINRVVGHDDMDQFSKADASGVIKALGELPDPGKDTESGSKGSEADGEKGK